MLAGGAVAVAADAKGAVHEKATVWKDPDFDPRQRAFYYARVLEIPTPRWTAYDAKCFGIQPLPGTTMTLQERPCTSTFWYTGGRVSARNREDA